MMHSCNTLYFVATFFEAKALLNSNSFIKIRRNHFFSASLNSYLLITGIGPEKAHRGLDFLHELNPKKIVNIGLCAGISGVTLGQIISPDAICGFPPTSRFPLECNSLLLSFSKPLSNSHDFLNSHPELKHFPIIIADMEAFTLQKAAQESHIPFECFKVVSDFGADSFADSFSFHKEILLSQLQSVANSQQ